MAREELRDGAAIAPVPSVVDAAEHDDHVRRVARQQVRQRIAHLQEAGSRPSRGDDADSSRPELGVEIGLQSRRIGVGFREVDAVRVAVADAQHAIHAAVLALLTRADEAVGASKERLDDERREEEGPDEQQHDSSRPRAPSAVCARARRRIRWRWRREHGGSGPHMQFLGRVPSVERGAEHCTAMRDRTVPRR
jgi:hypothetical protein